MVSIKAEPDFRKTGDCNVLLVVDKGVGEKEVEACFKIADNQNGFIWCEFNSY